MGWKTKPSDFKVVEITDASELLATALAVGDKADRAAIDRAIKIRRVHRALRHALRLLLSGRVEAAKIMIEAQLKMLEDE